MTRDDDPERSDAELAALAEALAAASAPREIAPDDLDAIVAGALEGADFDAEEAAAAEALRHDLEAGRGPVAELAVALRAAASPRDLPAEAHARLVQAALPPARGPRDNVRRVAFGAVATTLALAASVVFVVRSTEPAPMSAQLVPARSTQALFDEPFTGGGTTARIDRIASARAGDFRANRFATWGVR